MTAGTVATPTQGPADALRLAAPRIGPNAVLQTLDALRADAGDDVALRVATRADLPEIPLDSMVPEAWFVALVDALRAELPPDRSAAVLAEAGRRTADYVRANRIPAPFRTLLSGLPARVAVPTLLAAVRKHAWTFAGAGRFSVEGRYPGTLVLEGSPTCRARLGRRGGAYYEAAFERLLGLASPSVRVEEVACQAAGAPACRFTVHVGRMP